MRSQRFTARIGHGASIAEDATYEELVDRVLEFVARAAIGKANDCCTWEGEELRRQGLRGIEFAKGAKALWWDRDAFAAEKAEAQREHAAELFLSRNEFDRGFFDAIDSDIRRRLRNAGYATESVFGDMKEIYREIAADASDRSAQASEMLIAEILGL